jgi:hypothetical protein
MAMDLFCPECCASWDDNLRCEGAFYQMLYWENEYPGYGEVHHLTILCYYLQHLSLYSQENLVYAIQLLADLLESGIRPQGIRERDRDKLRSDKRKWKIKGTPEAHGEYLHPIKWRMTAVDGVARDEENYPHSLRDWVRDRFSPHRGADFYNSWRASGIIL